MSGTSLGRVVPEQLSLASGKRQGHENGVTGQKLASVEDSWKPVSLSRGMGRSGNSSKAMSRVL